MLTGKRIVITGGTGSLGTVLVRRLLSGALGTPDAITVLSRDEAKQHAMRLAYEGLESATDEVIYNNFKRLLRFRIGDVRDLASVTSALRDADIVFNAAALKQVPTCEYFPSEAVKTNVGGAENIVRAIRDAKLDVQTVIGISTDKAVKPVNVMGMTKAIQERVFIEGNLECPDTRFVCARYGNVLASRGSVIPLFHHQIRLGGPVTITDVEMTRFLLSLEEAVDTVLAALAEGQPGETYIPRVPSARVVDIAQALIGERRIETRVTGIRPGEKVHEILVSEEESQLTVAKGRYYAILPRLPELRPATPPAAPLQQEYSSRDDLMSTDEVGEFLAGHGLLPDRELVLEEELLR